MCVSFISDARAFASVKLFRIGRSNLLSLFGEKPYAGLKTFRGKKSSKKFFKRILKKNPNELDITTVIR
jgi:hypothetical protein